MSEIIKNVEMDYSDLDTAGVIENLKALKGQADILAHEEDIVQIVTHFHKFLEKEKEDALLRFKEDGGHENDFEYRLDPLTQQAIALIADMNKSLRQAKSNLVERYVKNTAKKKALLEELRTINEAADLGNKSLNRVKEIQEEWRASDPVISSESNELWHSYKALLDIFYQNRKLIFDLKDLDRKKNLEEKIKLCEQAEKVVHIESVNEATYILNDLHKQYKSIGPVPEEQADAIWERFKTASDVFHAKREQFMQEFKQKLETNFQAKEALLAEYETFVSGLEGDIFWKEANKTFDALEEKWKAIGRGPNDKIADLNKKYWFFVKEFLRKRNQFYKQLDAARNDVKNAKDELLGRLQAILEQENFQDLRNDVIKIQKKWWDSGVLSKKIAKEYNDKFKALCDAYFEKTRGFVEGKEKELEDNLEAKKKLVMDFAEKMESGLNQAFENMKSDWASLGAISGKKAKELEKAMDQIVAKIVQLDLEEEEKENWRLKLELMLFEGHPNAEKLIYDKVQQLKKEVSAAEDEVVTLKNNATFFTKSKNAEKILEEFDVKIADLEKLIGNSKSKIRLLLKKVG